MRRLRTTRRTRRKLTMLPVPGSSMTKAGRMVHRSTSGMKRNGKVRQSGAAYQLAT